VVRALITCCDLDSRERNNRDCNSNPSQSLLMNIVHICI
jgi:hypothetical protein